MLFKKSLKYWLALIGLGLAVTLLFGWSFNSIQHFFRNFFYTFFLLFLIKEGNEQIVKFFEARYSWINQALERSIIQLLAHLVYSSTVILLLNGILLFFFFEENYVRQFSKPHLVSNLIIGLLITIFILLFFHGAYFFHRWKESLIRAERLEKEKAITQYQVLKAQVNPHFLFNCLNSLAALIHQDAAQASRFNAELSKVYRYLLEQQENEVVSLEEELGFVQSYFYLMNIRHGQQLRLLVELPETPPVFQVIPLTLQILLENAIKHNIIPDDRPLEIEIFLEGEKYLIVKNVKNGTTGVSEGLQTGLKNLRQRYTHFTEKEIVIENTSQSFTVKIPLLQYEMHPD